MPPETEEAAKEEVIVEEIKEIPAEEVEKPAPIPEVEARIEKIVQGIKDKLDTSPANKGPTPEEIHTAWREQVKKETSMTDAQIEYMENRMQAVTAPLFADQTYAEWKAEKQAAGITIEAEVENGVKEYLSKYDPRVRNDKILLDNVLYMEIGKRAVTKKPVQKIEQDKPEPVIGRTIVPQTPAPAVSLASGTRKPGAAAALTADEKNIARKMRMTEAEYAAAKETAVITELKKK